MAAEESIVQKRREPFGDAILPENKDELARFMEQPVSAIAELLTAAMAAGPKSWMMMTGHLVQGMLKGKLFEQVSREIKQLRDAGKIPEDFAEKKYGFKSWVELMTVIDEETPDADRFEAAKAMFYQVNKVNADDGERIVAYQLFQTVKKLTSGELLYLRGCYELFNEGQYQSAQHITADDWLKRVANKVGHGVLGLLNRDDFALAQHGLLHERTDRTSGSSGISQNNARLTDLGIKVCEYLREYKSVIAELSKESA